MQKIIFLTCTYIALFAFGNCFAQSNSVKGQIVDASTGEPLAYAHIVLLPSGASTVSNTDGFFLVEAEGGSLDTLTVSYVGYTFFKISVATYLNQSSKLQRKS
jgi:CarboxypepD_reg-like domain